ncbi:hypothetical protein LWI28_020750 [Acer negundo]|uniref:Uncharacterized protein n=1 Tax=Acer negundo TaxID=4023 RepID=A0AAD5J0M2_ACENE|nr:hypothetical protein LWI28_020750 [Acer negundo]
MSTHLPHSHTSFTNKLIFLRPAILRLVGEYVKYMSQLSTHLDMVSSTITLCGLFMAVLETCAIVTGGILGDYQCHSCHTCGGEVNRTSQGPR